MEKKSTIYADVSGVSPSSEQTGLTLEMSAKHHIPQAINIPYQPLLIKPILSVLAHAEKTVFYKEDFEKFLSSIAVKLLKMF